MAASAFNDEQPMSEQDEKEIKDEVEEETIPDAPQEEETPDEEEEDNSDPSEEEEYDYNEDLKGIESDPDEEEDEDDDEGRAPSKEDHAWQQLKKENKELKRALAGKANVDEVEQFRKELVSDRIDSILGEMTSNDAEQRLILHYYNTSLKHTGYSGRDIRQDLETARFLANRNRIMKTNKELAQRLFSKSTSQGDGDGSNQTKPKATLGNELSDDDKRFLQQRGKNPDDYRLVDGVPVKVKK